VGYVAAAHLIPLIGFLLLGGVVADRLPQHQVMVAANALQALAQAASAVLLLAGHARVWELAVLAAARGIGTGFYLPASEGLLRSRPPHCGRRERGGVQRELGHDDAAGNPARHAVPALVVRRAAQFRPGPVGTTVAGPLAGSCSRGETATLT
jgi:hypothetical protein